MSVESECGAVSVGRTYVLPPLSSAVPHWFDQGSVSTPRSSNRTRGSAGTLQVRVFSSFTASLSLPMISRAWCNAFSLIFAPLPPGADFPRVGRGHRGMQNRLAPAGCC